MLSVSVTEEFKHPNGKPGTVSYDRTAVVNKLQEEVPEIMPGKLLSDEHGYGLL